MNIVTYVRDDLALAMRVANAFTTEYGGAFMAEGKGFSEEWGIERSYRIESVFNADDYRDVASPGIHLGIVRAALVGSDEDSVLVVIDSDHYFVENERIEQ